MQTYLIRNLAVIIPIAFAATGTSRTDAAPVFFQGFETDTSGWFDSSNGWSGTVDRVSSGTGGINSSSGSFHAQFRQGPLSATGPFTRFDGYRDTWPGTFAARADIYLDPTSLSRGEGFDYSVAASRTDGNHLRDFIFHVTMDTSSQSLLVGGSNNSNFAPREDLDSINNFEVTSPGWYTFEHLFRDDNGVLAVDLNLRDSMGGLLFTETRSTPSDLIGTVAGGNRYGWFTHITVDGGIAVDNTQLLIGLEADVEPIPEPTSLVLFGLTLAGAAGYGVRRRRRQLA